LWLDCGTAQLFIGPGIIFLLVQELELKIE